jgi:hypothetical protein
VSVVQLESGYSMRFDLHDDGPHPGDYYIHGLWIADKRVPEEVKDELYRLAWTRYHERRSGADCCE